VGFAVAAFVCASARQHDSRSCAEPSLGALRLQTCVDIERLSPSRRRQPDSKACHSMDLANSRVVVTGGSGFLGRRVVAALQQRGCRAITIPRSTEYDLRDRAAVQRLFRDATPDIVIHLAAVVGGIGANRANPGRFFYENAIMGIETLEQARIAGISKFVGIGTICSYPKHTTVPFHEDDLWNGYPEETNAPYGLAKKMLLVQSQAYRAQYGYDAIHLLPVNLFGPGDNFHPDSSHVIPALIRKMIEAQSAGLDEVVVWGDGTPTREFLFVDDAAAGIVLATEAYAGNEPVNLGSGREIAIADLAREVAAGVGFTGKIVWDTTKPNGQPRRCLDTTRASRLFGFQAQTGFADGLRQTIAWYREQLASSLG
jgi:GDP-L-fucose synthase